MVIEICLCVFTLIEQYQGIVCRHKILAQSDGCEYKEVALRVSMFGSNLSQSNGVLP